jgi:hypothetical protein
MGKGKYICLSHDILFSMRMSRRAYYSYHGVTSTPLFYFGYGLSYTTWSYKSLTVTQVTSIAQLPRLSGKEGLLAGLTTPVLQVCDTPISCLYNHSASVARRLRLSCATAGRWTRRR